MLEIKTKGLLHTLSAKQKIPLSKEEAWEFLSNPKNLKEITPNNMGFDIVSGGERPVYEGSILQYAVRPLLGLKLHWVSEITNIKFQDYFIDEQRFGPYEFWKHAHFITEIPGGILMEDIITYKLPLGFLGKVFHPILVAPKLKSIFAYRKKILEQKFGSYEG
jgi:ligand-binding SRPBCC domain-containing protein